VAFNQQVWPKVLCKQFFFFAQALCSTIHLEYFLVATTITNSPVQYSKLCVCSIGLSRLTYFFILFASSLSMGGICVWQMEFCKTLYLYLSLFLSLSLWHWHWLGTGSGMYYSVLVYPCNLSREFFYFSPFFLFPNNCCLC